MAAILIYVHDYTKSRSHFNSNGSARLDYVEIGRKILVINLLHKPRYKHFRFFDFSAAILDLQLNGTVYKIADTTIKTFDPENIGVADNDSDNLFYFGQAAWKR